MPRELWFKLTATGSVDESFSTEVRDLQGIPIDEFLEQFFTELIREHVEENIRIGDIKLEAEWVEPVG